MVVLGPAVGNYATSVVYRLPLGKTPWEKHPYCGSCGTMLQPRDLFPILSYVLGKGKCRYCGYKIPLVYTLVEVGCGFVFVINFLLLDFGEEFLLFTTLGVFLVTLIAIEAIQGWLSASMLSYVFAIFAILGALYDGTVMDMLKAMLFWIILASLVSIAWIMLRKRPKRLPDTVWLFGLLGVAPLAWAPFMLVAVLAIYLAQRALVRNYRGWANAVGWTAYAGMVLSLIYAPQDPYLSLQGKPLSQDSRTLDSSACLNEKSAGFSI